MQHYTLMSYAAVVWGFEKFTGRSLVELAPLLETPLHHYVMHLADVGTSRNDLQWITFEVGTVMELVGLPRPNDDLLKWLLHAVPQPTPVKHKAAVAEFPIKPALGLLHADVDSCMLTHHFAYWADLSMAILLLFWPALSST